jgi:excisionase family DNA binding protein
VIIVISPDPRDALRVAGALGLLERHLRANGSRLPDTLRAPVVHAYDDSSRPDTTPLATGADVPDPAGMPLLLDYREAARRLGVSTRTVQRLTAAGDLPVKRVGRRAFITPDALETYTRTA